MTSGWSAHVAPPWCNSTTRPFADVESTAGTVTLTWKISALALQQGVTTYFVTRNGTIAGSVVLNFQAPGMTFDGCSHVTCR